MNKNITEEQFNNCHKLADYLDALPDDYDKFHMGEYMQKAEHPIYLFDGDMGCLQKVFNECGTSACACGHGILAGIAPKENVFIEWLGYSKECFVGGDEDWDKNIGWYFVFSSHWNNLPKEAAARLRIFADSGVPEDWDRHDLSSFEIKYT